MQWRTSPSWPSPFRYDKKREWNGLPKLQLHFTSRIITTVPMLMNPHLSPKNCTPEQQYVAVEQGTWHWVALHVLQFDLTDRSFTVVTNYSPSSRWHVPRTPIPTSLTSSLQDLSFQVDHRSAFGYSWLDYLWVGPSRALGNKGGGTVLGTEPRISSQAKMTQH